MELIKTLEAIIDASDLDHQEKIAECARLTAIYMVGIDAESFSMKLGGKYKVTVSVEYIEE